MASTLERSDEAAISAGESAGPDTVDSRIQDLRLDKDAIQVSGSARRWRWWGGLVLLLLGIVFVTLRAYGIRPLDWIRGQTVVVRSYLVEPERPLDVAVDATGFLVAGRSARIDAMLPGQVVAVEATVGETVEEGDVLIRLDDAQQQADFRQAEAAVETAEARLKELERGPSKTDLARAKSSVEQTEKAYEVAKKQLARMSSIRDTISDSEFDIAESAAIEAETAKEQARFNLEKLLEGPSEDQVEAARSEVKRVVALRDKAELLLQSCTLETPLGGVVTDRNVDVGQWVRPDGIGSALMEVSDHAQLYAEADIQERQSQQVELEQPCLVIPGGSGDAEYHGTVTWMAPTFNQQRGVRQVRVTLDDSSKELFPGLSCRIRFLRNEPPSADVTWLRVPSDAITTNEETGESHVFVGVDGIARKRQIETGAESPEGLVEIRSGLNAGDRVLITDQVLHDGSRISPLHTAEN